MPDTPQERLQALLHEAKALVDGSESYLLDCTSAPSAAADALERKTRTADWPKLHRAG